MVVSDLHVGSIYGLLPEGFVTSDDKVVEQNPGQKYLWQCWEHLISTVRGYPFAAVVVNGDVIDGTQRKQNGTELSLPLMADQTEAAIQVLLKLKKVTGDAKWFFVQGTEYHVGHAARDEEVVACALGATKYNGLGSGRYCREVLDLEIDKIIINFGHHVSGGGGIYRATGIDREAIWSALAGKDGKMPRADALVRSHVHYFCHVEHESKHAVITPCWQLQTRHARHKSVYKLIPTLGGIVLWLSAKAKAQGEDGIIVQKCLYNLPPYRTTKL